MQGRFTEILNYINEHLSYKMAPQRLFDRVPLYDDLKVRLLSNLLLASKVAERDGIAIMSRYKSIDSYL